MGIKRSTWVTGILMVGLTVALLPMARAATTYLSPGGGDDTPAFQAALNNCIGATTDCVVQLSAGTFHTRQLAVQNFRGTLRGAGKTKTVILAEKDLEITNKVNWYWSLPGPANTWPFLLTFVDGAVNLQGLTIRISEEKPTTGYFEPYLVGQDVYFLWGAVLLTNTNALPMPSSVDDMSFEGRVVDQSVGTIVAPRNVYTGYTVQIWSWPAADPPRGNYTITSSDFVRMAVGTLFADIGPSQLTIGGSAEKGNRFNSLGVGIDLIDFDGSRIDASFNRMADMQVVAIFAAQGWYLPQTAASSLRIRNNTVEANTREDSAGAGWHSGIQLWENFGGLNPSARWNPVEISSNAVEVSFPNTGSFFDHNGISLVNVSGATVQGNRIAGTAENALYVGGTSASSGDTLAGNNPEQFRPHAGRAEILLDTTSEYCTVYGSGNTTVTDKGTGNTIYGARRQ